MKRVLLISVILLIIFSIFSKDVHAEISKGVNYDSLYHEYSSKYTTNDTLRRDFSRFQQDGISVISISLYWYRLEGDTMKDYDGTRPDGSPYGNRFLDDVKRVISIAHGYEIKVLVDIHTLWSRDDSAWCTPNYVIDPVSGENKGLAIVRSEDMRQAFLDMFNHTVNYLNGTEGIWAWSINEPWYWGRASTEHDFVTENGKTQKENFITLFQNLSYIVKTYDGRPFMIRFVNAHTTNTSIKNIFVEDWGWDQRIFDSLDFIGFNDYLPKNSTLYDKWYNITKGNMDGSVQHNKKVFVTEFGYFSDNDTLQSEMFEKTFEFYKNLPISGLFPWFWRCDSWKENPGLPGKGYNICLNATTGEGRQAYYKLVKFYKPVNISGQLNDKSGNIVNAKIALYEQGTDIKSYESETVNGNYVLSIRPSTYDVQYNIPIFFISNFWIKMLSINITSNLQDMINYITAYPSENKISFTVNLTGSQTIQTYSLEKPKRVLINGTEIKEVRSLSELKDNTWFYDSIEKKLYIKKPSAELGVWNAHSGDTIPAEADWIIAVDPNYGTRNTPIVLNWWSLHPAFVEGDPNKFKTESDIKTVEEKLKTVPAENFWGIIFISAEHYKTHVDFNDSVNTTWFGEALLGYPLYLREKPGATKLEWREEMYFRMIRGFYNYFKDKTKVGITAGGWPQTGIGNFGVQGWDFVKENYDFVVLYLYTTNLEDFNSRTKSYFDFIDANYPKQKKFWILTRIWDSNQATWEREAIALEMKNCLDRKIIVTTYISSAPKPPFEEVWSLMLKATELYDTKAPYFESYFYGKNLLTGYVGNTYGWIDVK